MTQEEREMKRQKALRDNLKRRKQMLSAAADKRQKPNQKNLLKTEDSIILAAYVSSGRV